MDSLTLVARLNGATAVLICSQHCIVRRVKVKRAAVTGKYMSTGLIWQKLQLSLRQGVRDPGPAVSGCN